MARRGARKRTGIPPRPAEGGQTALPPASGVMHLKTGRLDHVSAVAGYVRAANEKTYVVAVVMNSEDAHRGPGQELEEAVLRYTLSLP